MTTTVGRERELWDLAAFTSRADGRDQTALALVGPPGSGRSTLLAELATRTGGILVTDAATVEPLISGSSASGLIVLVDDDDVAAEQLAELLRRLRRLPPGQARVVLAATDRRAGELDDAGIDVVELGGLRDDAMRTLLDARGIAGPVADLLLADAVGNPGALLDFADSLSADEASGRRRIPRPLPLTVEIARRRADASLLGRSAALLPLALEPALPLGVFLAVAGLRDAPDEITAWERAGIVAVDVRDIRLTSPVLRSVVAAIASPAQLRAAQLGLAQALGAEHGDRAAWHRVLAAGSRDPALADDLARTLDAARRHGGPLAVADALELASDLAADPDTAARRRVDAAYASWEAGWRQRAHRLLAEALPLPDDPEVRARHALVSGTLALSGGHPTEAFDLLVRGADSAIGRRDGLALDLTARAAGIAWWRGDPALAEDTVALAVRTTRSGDLWSRFVREMTVAGRDVVAGRLDRLRTTLRRVLATGETLDAPRRLIFAAESAGLLGDDGAALRFLERAVRLLTSARDPDAPFALELLALVNAWQGALPSARAAASAGLALAGEFGEEREAPFQWALRCHLAALEGDVDLARDLAAAARRAVGPVPTVAWALGRLELALGRPDEALTQLRDLVDGPGHNSIVSLFAAPDLVEAATEVGASEIAVRALESFERWRDAGSPWALAVAPRLRALLSEGEERIARLEAAAHDPEIRRRPFEEARTLLLVGRELRRSRRRAESREYFRAALVTFELFGLGAWAERTRTELRAAGEAGTATLSTDLLTPQELEITRLVGEGASNRDVAARLHLSSRTVEYHLSKVYVKLGVSGRAQLAQLVGSDESG